MPRPRVRPRARSARARSADPLAIERRLDKALDRRMAETGDPVQFVGFAHTQNSYVRWRAEQLTRMPGAGVPAVLSERWPLVLWAMKPAAAPGFVRQGTATDLYAAPQVGMFEAEVSRDVALAAVIAAYLDDDIGGSVRIAPPILAVQSRDRWRYRLAPLDRTWTLPATAAVGIRR